MAELPKEVVIKIILLLPIKSVLRCQLLSKSFKETITSSDFINLYSEKPTNQDYVMINQNRQTRSSGSTTDNQTPLRRNYFSYHDETFSTINRELDCPFQTNSPIPMWLNTVGCCRGLVCLADPFDIYFWNPTINKSKVVPHPGDEVLHGSVYGFGFSQKGRDFKVVKLAPEHERFPSRASYKVDVYSLGSNSWKRVENKAQGTIGGPSTTVKGVVHWLASVKPDLGYYILGFDMDEEVFHEITLPMQAHSMFVGNYNDSLCVHFFGPDGDSEIWVMKEYGKADSWTRLLEFRDYDMFFSFPLSLIKNGELLNWIPGEDLALYDTKSRRFTKDLQVLKHIDIQENNCLPPSIYTYRESLYLLNEQEVTKVTED